MIYDKNNHYKSFYVVCFDFSGILNIVTRHPGSKEGIKEAFMKKHRLMALLTAAIMTAATVTGAITVPASDSDYTLEDLMEMDWAEIEELAKKEGEVVFTAWYNEAGYTELLQKFEEKYGIKAKLVVAGDADFAQKALTERDNKVGTIDAALIGNQIKTLLDGKTLAGPILEKMEALDYLDPDACKYQEGMETNGYVVPLYFNQTGLLYNSNNISADEVPQTFEELEAYIENHPGKFGFNIPEKGGSGQSFVHSVIGALTGGIEQYYGDSELDEEKTAKWSAVWDWLREHRSQMVITTGNNDSISRVNQGQIDLTVAWNDDLDVARAAGEIGDWAILTVPEMGLAGGGDTLGMLANAPHKAAALLLINYLTSKEGQEAVVDILAAIPIRTDMDSVSGGLTADDMKNRIAWFPIQYKTKMIQDFNTEVM